MHLLGGERVTTLEKGPHWKGQRLERNMILCRALFSMLVLKELLAFASRQMCREGMRMNLYNYCPCVFVFMRGQTDHSLCEEWASVVSVIRHCAKGSCRDKAKAMMTRENGRHNNATNHEVVGYV